VGGEPRGVPVSENWLIESERPNRTEIYQKFEQEVRGGEATTDYLETVVLNYIDRMTGWRTYW